jgi:hypothetical protein
VYEDDDEIDEDTFLQTLNVIPEECDDEIVSILKTKFLQQWHASGEEGIKKNTIISFITEILKEQVKAEQMNRDEVVNMVTNIVN